MSSTSTTPNQVSPTTSPTLTARLKEEKMISKQIEKQLRQDKRALGSELKLLLLGTGDSGKSTIVKQMKILHLKGYTDEERLAHKTLIYKNLVEIVESLVSGTTILKLEIPSQFSKTVEHVKEIIESTKYENITPNDIKEFEELCKSDSFVQALANSSKFQLHSSSPYFIDNLKRIADAGTSYVPTDQDILHTRVATTAISETKFSVKGINFRMIDVGGQRGHRDKWIHHFSDVTAILFIISLSEYDQVLEEDDNTNRMQESMKVFSNIVNSRWFVDVPIILFLNKKDLFQEKIKKSDLKLFFNDYTGNNELDDAVAFLKRKILALNKTSKNIYTHVTTATDTTNINAVFNAVKDIFLRQTMDEGGV
ncbi:G-protein subunit alpha 7 [Tieghemostelium lacteum]|uniref:G-protein subunit alpha 7 n=1 Tax=Tieghemostelium lacteum TaxID=361077 RepID=A0A151Z4C3_TIELA|nr:G-protein subunit alpha 7 [Tieghemostelium lacteum]|eukprot:KYQ88823.1 G-protein subunit alpha 7 [Tieghemostelium lacteum]